MRYWLNKWIKYSNENLYALTTGTHFAEIYDNYSWSVWERGTSFVFNKSLPIKMGKSKNLREAKKAVKDYLTPTSVDFINSLQPNLTVS